MTAATGTPGQYEIQETIRYVLRPGPPPPYPELVALERTLLLAIADLYCAVAQQYQCDEAADGRGWARLNSIRYQTSVGLGHGLVSAHLQVRALARDCQWLAEQYTAGAVGCAGGEQ
ncbi:DUF6415 family natural product biosynthesis protein [Streptomyces decoyicus]|uniref:DUF6415 family natural product biosynthesis protein n=1 Tax=Streptomyces decoyicus TaxID=249567 RepID=A0ABZ1FDF5_9ACTN|nr:DUF6415 family natural product biosynthesis protein [Streptomyces decoyicus]WSB68072.1 DUF6415 family natural product biosynthesis protein [Streptomyces decoyicus]